MSRAQREVPLPARLARHARSWHKWTGLLLSLVMAVLAISGVFIAFKKELEYLQPAARSGTAVPLESVLPPAQIAARVYALQQEEGGARHAINRIELRPERFLYKVRLESDSAFASPRELQFDAGSGELLHRGVRGDQLWMDVHSFGIFGQWTKLILMSLAGVSLFWLSLSGLYLFSFPRWLRRRRVAPKVPTGTAD